MNMNGRVIYRGASEIDGAPIVVIAVGFSSPSTNGKTGNMLQTYILREDISPLVAIQTGQDSSICGDCTHRGTVVVVDGVSRNKDRTCYVNVGQGARGVWECLVNGAGYLDWNGLGVYGRIVRLGTYGDPAAVPSYIWESFLAGAKGHTGYTHQWRNPKFARLSAICMASVDTEQEAQQAHAMGWRTFRVALPSDTPKVKGEAVCPASAEAGKKLTCDKCLACSGTQRGSRSSIVIQAHGGFAVMANIRKKNATMRVAA